MTITFETERERIQNEQIKELVSLSLWSARRMANINGNYVKSEVSKILAMTDGIEKGDE